MDYLCIMIAWFKTSRGKTRKDSKKYTLYRFPHSLYSVQVLPLLMLSWQQPYGLSKQASYSFSKLLKKYIQQGKKRVNNRQPLDTSVKHQKRWHFTTVLIMLSLLLRLPAKRNSALLFVDIRCWQEAVLLMYAEQLRTWVLLLQKPLSNRLSPSS